MEYSTGSSEASCPETDTEPIERISVDENLEQLLGVNADDWLAFEVIVYRVVPCPGCARPVVKVRFDHDRSTRVCDATETRRWCANILCSHQCDEAF
jgi:hypothetical protein